LVGAVWLVLFGWYCLVGTVWLVLLVVNRNKEVEVEVNVYILLSYNNIIIQNLLMRRERKVKAPLK
jgi:hypothetical protein